MDEFDPEAELGPSPGELLLRSVARIAATNGIHCIHVSDELLIFPHSTLGETRVCMDPEGEPVLRFYTTPSGHLGFAEVSAAGEFANDWNHDCISPRIMLDYDDPTAVTVWGYTFLVVQDSPTTEQLEATLTPALRNSELFLEALGDAFPSLRQAPPSLFITTLEMDHTDEESDTVRPVDVERIEEILRKLGINRFQTDSSQSIYAWINDVLFAFVVDVGPSFIIKGHWDPNFRGEDFTRIFLTCNDWNRANHSAAAFCHSNSDGLQVRLDYAVMTGGGMSDAQMLTTLGRGIKHILHGIDDISRESVGNSPVEWP
ncbi:YbjN domain-containing protein [Corynebacterium striatum]|uniref:YbjN domain-containing protein n=1 Tax=Corynebacterium striatum TaxID=43770 RepID=UPI003B591FFF